MKSIIEREATFENNSDMEVKVTQKKLSRAFVKETQWSKTQWIIMSEIDKWESEYNEQNRQMRNDFLQVIVIL